MQIESYLRFGCIATTFKFFLITEESDDEDERPSRRRRIAERAAEGADDEEVRNISFSWPYTENS